MVSFLYLSKIILEHRRGDPNPDRGGLNMHHELFLLPKLFGIAPFLMLSLVVLAIFGLVMIFRRDLKSVSTVRHSNPAGPPLSPPPAFNKEVLRITLEEMVMQGKITRDAFMEITAAVKGAQPSSQGIPPSSSQKTELPTRMPRAAEPALSPPPAITPAVSSGFFSPDNIKTLLISGSALFVFSAYLFVRSYWEMIPYAVKFSVLLGTTAGFHWLGRALLRGKSTPKTTETFLTLAVAFVPFNLVAANIWLLNRSFSAYGSWLAGSAAMVAAAVGTALLIPGFSMGIAAGLGAVGVFLFGALTAELSSTAVQLSTSFAPLVLAAVSLLLEKDRPFRNGLLAVGNSAAMINAIGIIAAAAGPGAGQWPAAVSFLILGISFAMAARMVQPEIAYAAGACFTAALLYLLRHLEVSLHQYGFVLIPAGFLLMLRAWQLMRSQRESLAKPYLHFSQLVIGGSLLFLIPDIRGNIDHAFPATMIVTMGAMIAFLSTGFFHRQAAYTFAGSACAIIGALVIIRHYLMSFTPGVAVMAVAGATLAIAGMALHRVDDDQFGWPLSVAGLGTLAVALALLGTRWSGSLFQNGVLHTQMPAAELKSCFGVSLLGTAAYFFMSVIRRQSALLFPALASVSLAYIFFLEWVGVPATIFNIMWLVAGCMGLMVFSDRMKWTAMAQSFSIWAEMIFTVLLVACFAARPENAFEVMALAFLAFTPAFLTGRADQSTCLLAALYAGHYFFFSRHIGGLNRSTLFTYGLHLFFVNCATVFVRTLLTTRRPQFSVTPFRAFAILFSALSLLAALADKQHAWHLYVGYGALVLVISRVLYNGTLNFLGIGLLVSALELFLWATEISLTEAYTVPISLYLLWVGTSMGEKKDLRNMMFVLGQLALYLPSFSEALRETWEWHGIFLGVASLAVLLVGVHTRSKVLTGISCVVLLLNAGVQSAQFLSAIPRWIYLAAGGLTLVGLGGIFEFKRESLIALKNSAFEHFQDWD